MQPRRLAVTCGLWLGFLVALVGGPARPASASIIFDAFDHPNLGWGLITIGGTFHFDSVQFIVDENSGLATLSGQVIHQQSGQVWQLSANFDGIRSTGSFASGSVPYAGMMDDLLNGGDGGGAIIWGGSPGPGGFTSLNNLTLTTSILNPAYTGPTSFIVGQADGNGDAFGVSVNDAFHPPAHIPGFGGLGASGWWGYETTQGVPCETPGWCNGDVVKVLKHGGDSHFILSPTSVNPVPEPGTFALFGLGLIPGAVRRRLFRRSRKTA